MRTRDLVLVLVLVAAVATVIALAWVDGSGRALSAAVAATLLAAWSLVVSAWGSP